MKYFQPYGVSNPEAPYIAGNPTTGTMGSIPPPESIEHPQRELRNLISKSAMTPSPTDLWQVAKSHQAARVIFGVDSGATNIVSIALDPIPDMLWDGMVVRVRINNQNTGPAVLAINAFGGKPIVHPDQTPMQAGELKAGMYCEFIYDQPHQTFQLIGSQGGGVVIAPPTTDTGAIIAETLMAPRTYYVNGNTGSDTLYDGTTPTISGGHGPYKTIQKPLDQLRTINTNGWNVTIYVADYPSYARATCNVITGSGMVLLIGNIANPQNVVVTSTESQMAAIQIMHGAGRYWIRGFKVVSTLDCGVRVFSNSLCWLGDMDWGACAIAHYQTFGGVIGILGGADVSPLSKMYISGGAQYHVSASAASYTDNHGPDLIFRTGGLNFSTAWAYADCGGVCIDYYNTISGTCNGPKYLAQTNGVIFTGGRGASYLPGSVAGSVATGGQYA